MQRGTVVKPQTQELLEELQDHLMNRSRPSILAPVEDDPQEGLPSDDEEGCPLIINIP